MITLVLDVVCSKLDAKRSSLILILSFVATSLLIPTSFSAADWPTFGHDPQRSGWAFEEHDLSPADVSHLELEWSTQVDNIPLALDALTAPIVASNVVTTQGVKTVVYVAGSSDTFFALDAQTGKIIWSRTFESDVLPKDESFFLCPNAANATPVIDRERNIVYTIAQDGKVYGLDLGSGATKFGPFQLVPAFAKAWSLNFQNNVLYTSTSQGCGGDRSGIYSMDVRNPMHPVTHELLLEQKYGAGMWGRGGPVIGKDGQVIVSTGDGIFDPSKGDYGSSFVAASLRSLQLLNYYTPLNWDMINRDDLDMSSGGYVWFAYKNYNLVAGGGKESVVYLLDADSLGGKDHHTPLFITPPLGNDAKELEEKGLWGAPAVWQDKNGQSWLYVTLWGPISKEAPEFPITNGPTPHGCIMAFRVAISKVSGKPNLEPAWISPDFDFPDPPVIANGVLFALSTGENPRQEKIPNKMHFKSVADWKNNLLTTAERGQGTRPEVLYALDAKTGKMLYQSGDSMKTWVHFSGLAIADGRIFAVDHESRVYCFGLKKEDQ